MEDTPQSQEGNKDFVARSYEAQVKLNEYIASHYLSIEQPEIDQE